MFGFLKKKLKEGIEKLKTSSDIEDDSKPFAQPEPMQGSSIDSDIAPFKPVEPKTESQKEASSEKVPEKTEPTELPEPVVEKIQPKEEPKAEEITKERDDLQEIAKDLANAEKKLIEKVDETEKLMIEKAREEERRAQEEREAAERKALEEREAADRKALEEEAVKKAAAELEASKLAESAKAMEEKLPEETAIEKPAEIAVPESEPLSFEEISDSTIQETPSETMPESQEAPKPLSDSDYFELKPEGQEVLEEMQEMVKEAEKPLVEEAPKAEPVKEKKRGIMGKLLRRKPKEKAKKEQIEEAKIVPKPEPEIPKIEPPKIEEPKPVEEGTGLVSKIKKKVTEKKLEEDDVKDMLKDLETGLLSSDVAMEATEKIIKDLKGNLVGKSIKRGDVENVVKSSFRNSLSEIMSVPTFDLAEKVKEKKPFVIVFLGFNGVGKTTSIARVGNLLKKNGLTCVFAAADSWRAAAIEQLEEHGRNLGVEVVKHKYGADPAAVIFDAVKHATAAGADVVLADTAGRSHSNANLMDELKKIIKVNKPDLKILVLDALTGNDIYDQCKIFNDAVGVDGMILTKADVYEKGGAAISAEFTIKKPILYMGTGEGYDNFEKFEPEKIIEKVLE